MDKTIALFAVISLSGCVEISSQNAFVQKNISIPGSTNGYSRDLVELNPNNFILIGTTFEVIGSDNNNRLTISGIDGSGNYQWHKSYGSNKFNYLPSVGSFRMLVKANGYLYSAVTARDSVNRQAGVFIKFNQNGDTIWQKKQYGNIGQDQSYYSLTPSTDNGFLILGAIQTNTPNYNNHPTVGLNIRKTDINGNKIWDKAFYTSNLDYVNYGIDIIQDSASRNIIVTGYETGIPNTFGIVLILDSLGNLKSKLGSAQTRLFDSNLISVIKTRDSNYVAVGGFVTDQILYTDYHKSYATIVKFDPDGNIIFKNSFDTLDVFNANTKIAELPSGNLIVLGCIDVLMNHEHGYNGLIRLMELDKNGNLLWKKYFDNVIESDNLDAPFGMILTSDSKIAFTTAVYEASFDPFYFTFYKTDTNYCDPNSIGCYATGIKSLGQDPYSITALPNPTSGKCKLTFSGIILDENPTIQIQNSIGQTVLEFKIAEFALDIDLGFASAGVYFLRIYQKGNLLGVKKIVVNPL